MSDLFESVDTRSGGVVVSNDYHPQHTDGPWHTCEESNGDTDADGAWDAADQIAHVYIQDACDNRVAEVVLENASLGVVRADGRLIAAAPQLLEFVRQVKADGLLRFSAYHMARAKTLIALVEGGESPR